MSGSTEISTNSSLPRGYACKVCDRKFYVRDMVKSSRVVIEEQASEISNLRRQVEALTDQCTEMETDFKSHKERMDGEIDRNR